MFENFSVIFLKQKSFYDFFFKFFCHSLLAKILLQIPHKHLKTSNFSTIFS